MRGGVSINVTPKCGLTSFPHCSQLALALSAWEWKQPYLPWSRLFTHNGDVTRHPTTQPPAATAVVINLIRCLPQTADTIFKWQLFCLGFLLRVAMPGNGLVIYIVCVSSNSWKQVENELITVIKPEFAFFTITSLEKGTHLKAEIASGGTEAIHECMC